MCPLGCVLPLNTIINAGCFDYIEIYVHNMHESVVTTL